MRLLPAAIFVALLLAGAVLPGVSAAQDVYAFRWEGSAGYRVDGILSVDPAQAVDGIVTEEAVTCFAITGWQDGRQIGSWLLSELTPETDWNLNLDIRTGQFRMGGHSSGPDGQAWNMDGGGTSCGPGGFGFNAGDAGQDLCLDGDYILASQVPPATPLAISPYAGTMPPGACRVVPLS